MEIHYEGTVGLFKEVFKEELPSAAIAAFVASTSNGEIHFKEWLIRRPWYDLANDPSLLSGFVLADYFYEGLQYTKSIPSLKSLDKAVVFPAQLVAIAALLIECQELSQALEDKKNGKEKSKGSLSELPGLVVISNLWEGINAALPLRTLIKSIPQETKEAFKNLVYSELPHQHELGMKKAHIYYMLRGHPDAKRDALIYFSKNWKKVSQSGEGVLKRVIEYAQTKWLNDADFKVTNAAELQKLTAEKCEQAANCVEVIITELSEDKGLKEKIPGKHERVAKDQVQSEDKETLPPSKEEEPFTSKPSVIFENLAWVAGTAMAFGAWLRSNH